MFLETLIKLREEVQDELLPRYFKAQEIKWALELDANGAFITWARIGEKKGLKMPIPYLKRSSGITPLLVADKSVYLLGRELDQLSYTEPDLDLPDEDQKKEGKKIERENDKRKKENLKRSKRYLKKESYYDESQANFTQLHQFIVDRAPSLAQNILRFREAGNVERAVQNAPSELLCDDIVALRIDGNWVHENPLIAEFWEAKQNAALEGKVLECLLCGVDKTIPKSHPIEIRIGADAAPFVSMNSNAFESFGLRNAENAPICQECATSYAEGANYLLTSNTHKVTLADLTILFWSRSQRSNDLFSMLTEPDEEDVRNLILSPFSSVKTTLDSEAYFLATMTSNKRLVLRGFHSGSENELESNIRSWFKELELEGADHFPKLYALASSTVRDMSKESPTNLIKALIHRALFGVQIPKSALYSAIRRCNAESERRVTKPRIALMKLVLNQQYQGTNMEIRKGLNLDDPRPSYHCGRLLFLLDAIQKDALGNIKSSVSNRYYGAASSAPATVFGSLIKNAQNHLSKLESTKPGWAINHSKNLQDILSNLSEFPKTLALEDQGIFAIGFYHQKQFRFTKKNTNDNEEKNND